MEGKKMKKPIPAELNEEKLDAVTGGSELAENWNPLPTTAVPGLIFEEPSEEN